jgi:arylsulfatase A-like enzyme
MLLAVSVVALLALALWLTRADVPADIDASYPAKFYGIPGTKHDGPNVLIVTVDTLRPDHLSMYGYPRDTSPNLAKWFADATQFENAYAAEANTTPSLMSMLTGLYPQRHGVRLLYQRVGSDVVTLPDRLRRAGYQTGAVVSNMVLTAEASGLSTRFDHYDDLVSDREPSREVFERNAKDTTDAAIAWLRDGVDSGRPHLLWVHYIDPHGPYTPPDDLKTRYHHGNPQIVDMDRVPAYQHVEGVTDGLAYVDRYDEEIAYVDREIGRLLAEYQAIGFWDDAIAVFTADHGETMLEHEHYFHHGYHVWEPIVRVPLAIRIPGKTASHLSHQVSLVDVTPTVLDAVDLAIPEGLDGRLLWEESPGRILSLEATFGKYQTRAALTAKGKWFAVIDSDGLIRQRWFTDSSQFPREDTQLDWPSGPQSDQLSRWITDDPDPGGRPAEYLLGEQLLAPKVALTNVPDADRERLRSLGYLE